MPNRAQETSSQSNSLGGPCEAGSGPRRSLSLPHPSASRTSARPPCTRPCAHPGPGVQGSCRASFQAGCWTVSKGRQVKTFQVPTAPHRKGKSTRKEVPGTRAEEKVNWARGAAAGDSQHHQVLGGRPSKPGIHAEIQLPPCKGRFHQVHGGPAHGRVQGVEGRWASLGTVPRGAGGGNSIETGLGQACFIFLKLNKSRGGHGIISLCLPESP